MASPIRLVAGLGNPGRGYASTRHNVGFWFADRLASDLGEAFAASSKFAGDVAKSGELRVVKPMTYMNESGRSVAALARFYNLTPQDILVVHDELDLPPGEVRLKLGGGLAGHNGVRDIDAGLGSADFWRLRIGIGHPRTSEAPEQAVVDYVLKRPRPEEQTAIEGALKRALAVWPDIAKGDMERAMQTLHTRAPEALDPPQAKDRS
jgi:PTH1 family peptidyl-tRNA hydrolase